MRVDPITPCSRNVTPPQCRRPPELLQSQPAPRMQPWQRKGSGLTWLANGNDAANEQERISAMPKPSKRSRDSQMPTRAGSTKSRSAFLTGVSKPTKPKAISLHNGLSWRRSSWKGGAEQPGEAAASSAQTFHRTRTLGNAALSLGGAELVPVLGPVRSAEQYRVGVNPRERLGYADSCSVFSEQAGLKGLVGS